MSDRIARTFNRSEATQAAALGREIGMLVFCPNLGLKEYQVKYLALFPLFSVIGSFKWFWMGSLHKNFQLMLEFLKGLFLVLHFSRYTLMTLLYVICNVTVYADDVTLYSKFDQASDLWKQLELPSELESDLRDTNIAGSIDVKMDGPVLEENSFLSC